MGDTARLSDSQLDGNLLKLQTVNDRLDAIESDREKARIEALIQERLPSFPRGPVPVAEVQPEQHTAQESSTPGLYPELSPLDDDQTLYEEENPYKSHKVLIEDWSDTGRGSHVDFAKDETISLQQGRWLGRGITGDVYETTVHGWQVAHKQLVVNRKRLDRVQREIDILKRLSNHVHVVQLVGTYTYRQFLGMLIYPVAVCDLHTFFEDVEAWTLAAAEPGDKQAQLEELDSNQRARLIAMEYSFPPKGSHTCATPVYSRLGCLISAIAYLHDEKIKIRHKDLKPSNILISAENLWLSDFGSATDFSMLSQSATDNERGTLRYFSPEVAAWEPNGRAADIFSLGCVLLEIIVLHDRGTLEHIRQNRSPDPSFHSNLGRVDTWCKMVKKDTRSAMFHVLREIKIMLNKDAALRPTAHEILTRVTGYDLADSRPEKQPIFGRCCTTSFVSDQQRREEAISTNRKMQLLKEELRRMHNEKHDLRQQLDEVQLDFQDSQNRFITLHKEHLQHRSEAQLMEDKLVTLERERTAALEQQRGSQRPLEDKIMQLAKEKEDLERSLDKYVQDDKKQRSELQQARDELAALKLSLGWTSPPVTADSAVISKRGRPDGETPETTSQGTYWVGDDGKKIWRAPRLSHEAWKARESRNSGAQNKSVENTSTNSTQKTNIGTVESTSIRNNERPEEELLLRNQSHGQTPQPQRKMSENDQPSTPSEETTTKKRDKTRDKKRDSKRNQDAKRKESDSQYPAGLGHDAIPDTLSRSTDSLVAEPGDDRSDPALIPESPEDLIRRSQLVEHASKAEAEQLAKAQQPSRNLMNFWRKRKE